jgi:hypothetical protein
LLLLLLLRERRLWLRRRRLCADGKSERTGNDGRHCGGAGVSMKRVRSRGRRHHGMRWLLHGRALLLVLLLLEHQQLLLKQELLLLL